MHTNTPLVNDAGVEPSNAGRVRSAQGPAGGEVDLGEYVRVLWRRRLLLAVASVVCALVAFGMGLRAPALYEAEATMAVSRPKFTAGATDTTAVANFLPFVTSRSVAAQVIKELGLDRPPYTISPTSFFGGIVVVEEVRNSTIVLVRGRLSDPTLVARVVNRVADIGSEAVRRASQQEAVQARDDIKLQLQESIQRVEQSEDRLRRFREASQVEVVEKDVEAALAEREGLLKLQIDIEAEKSKLARAEQELASRQKVVTLKRSIDSDPLLLELARKTGNGQADNLVGLQLVTEETNRVYQILDELVAESRSELAAMERRKAQLTARKLDTPHVEVLHKLYQIEGEISRLEMERDLSRKVYEEVASSYETTRLVVAGRSSALQIITPASAPDRPVASQALRTVLIAFFAGLIVTSLGVLLFSAVSSGPAVSPSPRPQ
jgi:uncharacterized protein involved in exopolysaccharide biosynthesis